MRIGILICGHLPEEIIAVRGDYDRVYADHLAGQGFSFDAYPVCDMVFPDSIHAAEGWLISGSRHGAYEDHAFIPPLEAFLREAYAAHVPIVGICFGHQILAQALGGTVIKHPDGFRLARQSYDFAGETLALHAWHQDQVVKAPEGAEIIATSETCPIAGLRYGTRAFSVQPHPEFDDGFLDLLLEHRGHLVRSAGEVKALQAGLGAPIQSDQLAQRIGAFFRAARQADAAE